MPLKQAIKNTIVLFTLLLIWGCSDSDSNNSNTISKPKEKAPMSKDNPFKPMVDSYNTAKELDDMVKKDTEKRDKLLKSLNQ